MKKTAAICSLIICVALVFTLFTSCNGEKGDETQTEQYIPAVTNGTYSFTAEVGEENTVIKNNGEEYQVLKYPQNAGYDFDYAYAKERSQFIDMNFDGQPDFYIAVSTDGNNIYYYCWLFNATTMQFDFSVSLSGLTNISVDAQKQVIYSTVVADGSTRIATYRWVDGQLKNADVYDSASDTIPQDVTQSAKDNIIGSVTRPALTTTKPATTTKKAEKTTKASNGATTVKGSEVASGGETATNNDVTMANTTTTSPRTSGIQVETGSINDGWY